jgi:hypothetical protein
MGPDDNDRTKIESEINYWHRRWSRGQRAWSFVNYLALFGAAIISVAIGYIVQIKTPLLENLSNENISTILAFCAAALSALAATGGFDRKWRAARLSRGRLDELRIDLMDSNADLRTIREHLKSIIIMHDQEVLGGVLQTNAGGALPQNELKPGSGGSA